MLDTVLNCAAEIFGDPVAAEDDFFDLGGDSVTAVELSLRLEQRLRFEVDPDLIVALPSLGALAVALQQLDPHPPAAED